MTTRVDLSPEPHLVRSRVIPRSEPGPSWFIFERVPAAGHLGVQEILCTDVWHGMPDELECPLCLAVV